METLPLVPFGKYKGEPITTLLNDANYLDWCKQQEWFLKKFPIVYNICVNQTISTNNQNSKTPEHNRIQNMFLEYENVLNLLKNVFKDVFKIPDEVKKCDHFSEINGKIYVDEGKTTFEGMYNWDIIVEKYKWQLICECLDDCSCGLFEAFLERYKMPEGYLNVKFDELYCEIKPCLGDDYPCVLRKMKTQIELTNRYAKTYSENEIDKLETEARCDREMRQYWRENKHGIRFAYKQVSIHPKYVLLIKDFESSTTTKEQLIKIFKQSDIKVVFIHELLSTTNLLKPTLNETEKTMEEPSSSSFCEKEIVQPDERQAYSDNLSKIHQKLFEAYNENKSLKEKLLQAEEQLKNENTSFKKSKNIIDYYGEK
jgi:uncharacterized protein (DUF3820 family)